MVPQLKKNKKFRSKFEANVCEHLTKKLVPYKYETIKIHYIIPESNHTYTPDVLLENGIIIEIKGRFVKEDRKKHLLIKQQLPHLDIRFILQNSKSKLYKGSKTTYAQWLSKNNFLWAEKYVPIEWINEKQQNNIQDTHKIHSGFIGRRSINSKGRRK
jgi:hypothetical protein|tara:strand:- start:1444 stop:1917 length:474 start_codon:yes stop_codon:yes gene_type:complete